MNGIQFAALLFAVAWLYRYAIHNKLVKGSQMETTLNELMSFEHVIRVAEDGTITEPGFSIYAELFVDSEGEDNFYLEAGWKLLEGFTGQYSYNGPVMHSSEFIGGGLERHIRETPGYYVALVVDGTEKHSWGESRFTGNVSCSNCGTIPLDEDDLEGECTSQEPAGWAVAFKPLEESN